MIQPHSYLDLKRKDGTMTKPNGNPYSFYRGQFRIHNITDFPVSFALPHGLSYSAKTLPQGMSPAFGIGEFILNVGQRVKAKHPEHSYTSDGVIRYKYLFGEVVEHFPANNEYTIQFSVDSAQHRLERKYISRGDIEITVLLPLEILTGDIDKAGTKVEGKNAEKRYVLPEDYTLLCHRPQRWTMNQLLEMVQPVRVGNAATNDQDNRFLHFMPHWWCPVGQVAQNTGTVRAPLILRLWSTEEEASVMSEVDGTQKVKYLLQDQERAYTFKNAGGKNQDIAIVSSTTKPARTVAERQALIDAMDKDLVSFVRSIESSGIVSLVQKLIRLRVTHFTHPDYPTKVYPAEDVLKAMVLVVFDPSTKGHFVAHIGKYVFSQTHFVKRLGVCMFEDSSWNREHANFFICAATLTTEIAFEPSAALEDRVLQIAIGLWASTRCNGYADAWGEQEIEYIKPCISPLTRYIIRSSSSFFSSLLYLG